MEKLEQKKEKIEALNDSFDFAKHDLASLHKVNGDIRAANRRQRLNELRYYATRSIPIALVAIVIAAAAHMAIRTPAPHTGAGIEAHQVAPGQTPQEQVHPIPAIPKPVIENDKAEQAKQLEFMKDRNEPDFLKQLKQSEGYKKNEALAKKLSTGRCSYKTTKQGDFYVCEFKGD